MTADTNEAVARRWHMDLFEAGKLDVVDEILAPDFVFHLPDQDVRGPEETRQLASAIREAYPDFRITHEDAVASGDTVAIRWTARGTHRGTYPAAPDWEVPPTGREIRMQGIDWYRMAGGKIAEAWIAVDDLGVLRQMGVVSPGQTGARAAMA